MIGPLYYGTLVAASIILPILAGRLLRIRRRYALPACFLLANALPLAAIETYSSISGARTGSTMGVAVMFGLIISAAIIFSLAGVVNGKTAR